MARRHRTRTAAASAVLGSLTLMGVTACGNSDQADASAVEPRGKRVFIAAGCGACHTLRDVGSTGTFGPDLDRLDPDHQKVAKFVTVGGVGMPAFEGILTPRDIRAVADYVSTQSGW